MPEDATATIDDANGAVIDAVGGCCGDIGVATPRTSRARRARPRIVSVVLALAWVFVATTLQLRRYVGTPPWRAVWAEDGASFLTEALTNRWGTILRPHSGYLQISARGMGSLAATLPLSDASSVFAIGGAAVVSMLAIYIYVSSASILTNAWARGLVAFFSVFAGVTAFEVAANGLDLHWYLLFASFWALWSTRTSRRWLAIDGSMVAVASLSGPLVVCFAPLAVRRALASSGSRARRLVVPGVWLVTVTVQMTLAATEPKGMFEPFRAGDLLPTYAHRVSESTLLGDRYLAVAWLHGGWPLAYLSLGVVVAVCIFGVVAVPERRSFVVFASLGSALIFCVELFQRGSIGMRPHEGIYSLQGSRYTVVPVLLLMSAIIAIADATPGGSLRRVGVLSVRAAAAAVLVITLLGFTPKAYVRQAAPDWAASLPAFENQCRAEPLSFAWVPIAPGPPFYAVVPCSRLLDDVG